MAKTQVVAKALLLDASNNFLLLIRSDTHPALAGYPDLPGGTIEENEEPGDGLIREVSEETGIIIRHEDIRVLYTTTKLMHNRSYPTLLYVSRIDGDRPDVTISWEHKSYEWAPMSRLPEVEPQLATTYQEALGYIEANAILEDIE